jgi:hypothetical protein
MLPSIEVLVRIKSAIKMSFNQPYYPVQTQDSLNFQSFEYGNTQENFPVESFNQIHDGNLSWSHIKRAFSTGGYDDEPPLLEGISVDILTNFR